MSIFRKKRETQQIPMTKPKTVNRKRAERLNLSLTPEEKALINDGAAKAGMSRTDFVLTAVRKERIVTITGLPKVYLTLYRHGNNLNQISKRLNCHNYVSKTEIERAIQECRDAYKTLVSFLDYWDVRLVETEVDEHDCEDEGNKAC